jgi:ABC-type phosphate/phosphonate transport system substrate-binding protein
MYDLPQLRDANEAFVAAVQTMLREDGIDPASTQMTQICGYPLQTIHRGHYTLLGMPCYDVAESDGPSHRAFIVVRSASAVTDIRDLAGKIFAVNSMHSNTGMNLPRRLLAPVAGGGRFFNRVIRTGSHRASMDAVRSGAADAAAVDSVTLGLCTQYAPKHVRGLRIAAQTSVSPSIPFVTPRSTKAGTVGALQRALSRLSESTEFAPLRAALRLKRIDAPDEAAYAVLLQYQAEAVALGYPQLA